MLICDVHTDLGVSLLLAIAAKAYDGDRSMIPAEYCTISGEKNTSNVSTPSLLILGLVLWRLLPLLCPVHLVLVMHV
jgi:hypothetical protein